jgi:hypothetical protein
MADLFTNMASRILKPAIKSARNAGMNVGSRKSSGSLVGSSSYRSKRKAKRS